MSYNPFDAIRKALEYLENNYVHKDEVDDSEPEPDPDPDPDPPDDGDEPDEPDVGPIDATEGEEWTDLGRDDPDSTSRKTGVAGIRLEATRDLGYLTVRLSSTVEGVTDAYLTDDEGDVLERRDAIGPGELVAFERELEAGETYRVVVDADGEEYTRGRADVGHEMPIEGDGLAVTNGVYSGHQLSESYRYNIDRVRAVSEDLPEPETLELPDDGQGQTGHSNYCGVGLVPGRDLGGVELRVGGSRYDGAKDLTAVHVFDDRQNKLATQTTTGLDDGDWVGIDYDFSEGQEYRVLLNGEGEEYVRYRAGASCPYTGDALDVIAGSYSPGDDSQTESWVYNIDRIRGSVRGGVAEPEAQHRNIELEDITSDPNVSVASDPDGGERSVASINCQEGPPQNYSVGARRELDDLVGHEPQVAHFRYQVYFPSDWEMHQHMNHGGTKMPGPADHRYGGGAGGNHNPGAAWSARGYATTRGPNDATEDDSDIPLGKQIYDMSGADKDYGHMHSWSRGANKGEWTTIDERYEMGEGGEYDSRIAAWVNGKKAFDRSDYCFVDEAHSYKGIHEWRWHFYFGGRWGSPKEQSKYIRRFGVWTGDNCPQLEGV